MKRWGTALLIALLLALPARVVAQAERHEQGPAIRSAADSIRRKTTAIEEAIYQTRNRSGQDPLNYPIRLNNRIAALSGVVASADARPTDQTVEVFTMLSDLLQAELERLRVIMNGDEGRAVGFLN